VENQNASSGEVRLACLLLLAIAAMGLSSGSLVEPASRPRPAESAPLDFPQKHKVFRPVFGRIRLRRLRRRAGLLAPQTFRADHRQPVPSCRTS
jgi:hypothetical protein